MNREQLAFEKVKEFDAWMRDTIDSVYYKDDIRMAEAYDKVFKNHLEVKVYENPNR